MKITPVQKSHILKYFGRMKTKADLLVLLNYAKKIIYGEHSHEFQLRQLNYYINVRDSQVRYRSFSIKKKNGGKRRIKAPVAGLKAIQKSLNLLLQTIYEPSDAVMGFIKGKGIVDNARAHLGKNYVLNIDLKDFFTTIEQGRIWGRLKLPPFNLNEKNKSLEVANIISVITTQEALVSRADENGFSSFCKRNVLPQGAPTSPLISNAVCQQLDFYLTAVAKRFGLKYTRYADDLTFSSMHHVYHTDGEFMKELYRIIKKHGFSINHDKTRLQKKGFRQEVTGLIVNDKINVTSTFIKQLRVWLKNWETIGYDETTRIFMVPDETNRGYVKPLKRQLEKVIEGKLNYLMMVKGKDDATLLKLRSRFEKLSGTNSSSKKNDRGFGIKIDNFGQLVVRLEGSQGSKSGSYLKHDLVIPGSTKVPEILRFDNMVGERFASKLLPHQPLSTIMFLKQFKVGDGSGFKELVHDTELDIGVYNDIIKKVTTHPNFIKRFHDQYITEIDWVNKQVQLEVAKLIELFSGIGKKYFELTGNHPFNNEVLYTGHAKKLKQHYRYGLGNEYTRLTEDLLRVSKEVGINAYKIIFKPEPRAFDIRASFYSWQPSIFQGLKYLLSGIADHTNINGEKVVKHEDKEIVFDANRIQYNGRSAIEIVILDKGSLAMKDSKKLIYFLKESLTYKTYFRSLCDWSVACDFIEEESKILHLLSSDEQQDGLKRIEELQKPVGGFKHILTFYDI